MRRLLNTLFVLSDDTYLALENENVVIYRQEEVLGRVAADWALLSAAEREIPGARLRRKSG